MGVVLVAGRPKELTALSFDAFSARHRALIQTLLLEHDVHVVQLAVPREPAGDPDLPGVSSVRTVTITRRADTRWDRIWHMSTGVGECRLQPWENELVEIARTTGADAAVSLGPWLGEEFRAIHRELPSIHFFEEDLRRMPELAPQSGQARLLRRVSRWALGHRAFQPRIVVAISATELRAASLTYPRASVALLPLTLDQSEWPIATTPSSGDAVLVVAVLSEPRNAEGLCAVLESVRRRRLGGELTFRLVTASGTHPMLRQYLDSPWVDAGPERGSIYDEYRRARCALIPAFRASGMKTTIIQAWATGCPVVSSAVCAAGVGEEPPRALLAAADPDEMVDALLRVSGNPELRASLAERGRDRMREDFDRARVNGRFLDIVRELTAQTSTAHSEGQR